MPPTDDCPTDAQADALLDDCLARCTFPDSAHLLCAVSGGADSAALLLLAHRHAAHTGAEVAVVHVDHGMRPGSAADAGRLRRLTDRLDVALRVERLDVGPGPNAQERARVARHAAVGPDALLGHTADDRAETVLLQLIRGGALDAVASMRAARRPLLALRRADTEAVCAAAGYEPLDDPANADPRFWRTRVRHEALPLLADISGRDVVPLLARAAALAADEADLLDELAADVDPTDVAALRAAPVPLARRALRRWLRAPR
ncbi:MAG TPA: tRNA lysidine(34) synthetase TilS, partial [Acidimicrobiaceae bacterium]|nr:tRNA lysidine(34) synthetase TilS [Acidimicrobiaceae bacterium]